MSLSVSLCVIRIEKKDDNFTLESTSVTCGAMAAENEKISSARGRREMRDITVESYFQNDVEVRARGLLSSNERETTPVSLEAPRRSCEPESKPKDQIHFISGNPFVEVTKGILHLYKEDELTPVDRAVQRTQMICMLAVPATMTCNDLLTFTAACHDDIQHLRIIRDRSPNQYMALLRFRTQYSAHEFYSSFNGISYSSLEPECCCHLVFVSRIEVLSESAGGGLSLQGHTELPTCPVCLERMDESVDGILTILCNHSFHGSCLAKWGDTSCPVCRYVQTPELVADNRCMQCHVADSLWMCLICGHVGCGRYEQGHAFQHYLQTQHCYAMQPGNNRVWDYVGDNFVHRLLQNKGDGKLVEQGKQQCEEKLDAVQLEFTYLLTSQLESQRIYFEEKMARFEQEIISETSDLKEKAMKAIEENQKLQNKISNLNRDKQANEKKIQQMANRLSSIQSELYDEKLLNQGVQQNQDSWHNKYQALDKKFKEFKDNKEKELLDVKEQLRDVMFFLEAGKQIAQSDVRDEIAEGRIVIAEPSPTSQPTTSNGKRERRRRNR